MGIDQKSAGNRQIPAAIEQVAINDVVDAGHILRREQDGEHELFLRSESSRAWRVAGFINVDADGAQTAGSKRRRGFLQQPQLLERNRRRYGPEMEQQRAAA